MAKAKRSKAKVGAPKKNMAKAKTKSLKKPAPKTKFKTKLKATTKPVRKTALGSASKAKIKTKATAGGMATKATNKPGLRANAQAAVKIKPSVTRSFAKPTQSKVATRTPTMRRKPADSVRSGVKASGSNPLINYVDASLGVLALWADPRWTAMIATHLHVILQQAALVSGFALPDDAEPAPIFKA